MAKGKGKAKYDRERRYYKEASPDMAKELGPLKLLPGTWTAKGTGWNMIALPFKDAPDKDNVPFRILMNQYDETLSFSFVDDNVPNRGIDTDQRVATLDYQQEINQTAAKDFPKSDQAGGPGLAIHHEPGLWIWVKEKKERTDGIDLARLASIPHGNAILSLGESQKFKGMPEIPQISALPFGRFEDLASPAYDFNDDVYLSPYKHFIENPFFGNEPMGGPFPGFNPRDMTEILRFANQGVDIARTTQLTVDTMRQQGGIRNMPFTVREAEPVSMRSIFWIQELKQRRKGRRKLRLQYLQVVMLDFFRPREDQLPGRAQWPHISIATLEKEDDHC